MQRLLPQLCSECSSIQESRDLRLRQLRVIVLFRLPYQLTPGPSSMAAGCHLPEQCLSRTSRGSDSRPGCSQHTASD